MFRQPQKTRTFFIPPWRDLIHLGDGGFPCEFSLANYLRNTPCDWRGAHRLHINTAYWRIQFQVAHY
jgi:hypothetical protein